MKSLNILLNFLKRNWLLILVVGFFLYQKIPLWIDQSHTTGQKLGSFSLQPIEGAPFETSALTLPHVLVFWATWCGPCKIEMGRLQRAVNKGELNSKNITAISFDEDNLTLQKSIRENEYTFNFVKDPSGDFSRSLHVRGTPTVVHINQSGEIAWISTGLSLLGVQKAIALFEKH